MPNVTNIQRAVDERLGGRYVEVHREDTRQNGSVWYLTGPGVDRIATRNSGDGRYPYPEPRLTVRLNGGDALSTWATAAEEAVARNGFAAARAALAEAHDQHVGPVEGCPKCEDETRLATRDAYLETTDVRILLEKVAEVSRALSRAAEDLDREVEDYRERPRNEDVTWRTNWRRDPAVDLGEQVVAIVTQAFNNARLGGVLTAVAAVVAPDRA